MRCTRKWELASSGVSPIFTNAIPNFAASEATIKSMGKIMVAPMPTLAPFTAAINGLDSRTKPIQSRTGVRSTPSMRALKLSRMSAPAQKPRPAPVTTMAPTAGSALQRSMASTNSSFIRAVQAFSRSGRFSVSTATLPSISNRICS